MKKFKFRLETILTLKEKTLNEKRQELAKVMNLLNDAKLHLEELNDSKEKASLALMEIYQGSEFFDLNKIQMYKEYLIKLDSNIQNQNNIIKQIEKTLKAKQEEVNQALIDKNILEKLKEKQSQKHYKEILHKEAVELDDISISRYKAG